MWVGLTVRVLFSSRVALIWLAGSHSSRATSHPCPQLFYSMSKIAKVSRPRRTALVFQPATINPRQESRRSLEGAGRGELSTRKIILRTQQARKGGKKKRSQNVHAKIREWEGDDVREGDHCGKKRVVSETLIMFEARIFLSTGCENHRTHGPECHQSPIEVYL